MDASPLHNEEREISGRKYRVILWPNSEAHKLGPTLEVFSDNLRHPAATASTEDTSARRRESGQVRSAAT